MTVKRKQYSKQFKFKVVVQLIKGEETLQQICSRHEIHGSVLQRWKKQFLENGADIFEEGVKRNTGQDSAMEKLGPLERKIGQLTIGAGFCKKSLGALNLGVRKAAIDIEDPLSISQQCVVLGGSTVRMFIIAPR